MKKLIACAISATLLASIAVRAEFEKNKIIVKLKRNSESFVQWQKNKNTGGINELNAILGIHNTKSFISNQYIHYSTKDNELQSNSPIIEGLSRIVVVEYQSNTTPEKMAQTISKLKFVEYAEPVPIHQLYSVPNDMYVDNQYYLNTVNSLIASDLINSDDTIKVAVVDTGVDYTHEDLAANIYSNPGEIGVDSDGNDKSSNGIDDDDNGFIDDFHGWDFVGTGNPDSEDNDPMPGNPHGTHVAGTIGAVTNNRIGIAGVAKNVKIIPVKIGADNKFSNTTSRGYEGILYAAKMGAKIINCSWGGGSSSNAEQEVINAALEMGSLVIAAAGNDGKDLPGFPASYAGVLSVAAIDADLVAADFTNYGETVDISAPGVNILATLPNNNYGNMSGTSMATPVTCGVAALVSLVHPNFNPKQLKEFIKSTANPSLYDINPNRVGQLGTGIVDAYRAITATKMYAIELSSYSFIKSNDTNSVIIGDEMICDIRINNVLDSISDLKAVVVPSDDNTKSYLEMIDDSFVVGDLKNDESKLIESAIKFKIVNSIPEETKLKFKIIFTSGTDTIKVAFISELVNKSFLDFSNNDILLTYNSRGNMAFNDFPSNKQGVGFSFRNSASLLFEGGVMIAVKSNSNKLFDGVRAENSVTNRDFVSTARIVEKELDRNWKSIKAQYKMVDAGNELDKITIEQYTYASNLPNDNNYIINEYNISNKSEVDIDSVYLGLYFDWDIGTSGQNCIAYYEREKGFAHTHNTAFTELPWIGMKSLSEYPVNYYGIDNDATSDDQIGVYNGFTRTEKFRAMTGGIVRDTTSITDISQVIAAGPFSLKAGETKKIPFSIFGGVDFDEISQAASNSANYLKILSVMEHPSKGVGHISIYPNPGAADYGFVALEIETVGRYTLELFDIAGQKIETIFTDTEYSKGNHVIDYNIKKLIVGTYYLVLNDAHNNNIVAKYVVTN